MSTEQASVTTADNHLSEKAPLSGLFFVGMALILMAIAVAGFWPTYWGPLLDGTLDLHWLIHLHGIISSSWLVLLIVQAALVRRGRTDLHQAVGKIVGVGLGLLVIASGLSMAFKTVGRGFDDLQGFIASLVITLPSIFAFAVLFGAGLAYRRRPAIHKRLMIVATLALLSAATARLGRNVLGLSGGAGWAVARGLPIGLAGLAAGYDRWTRGSVHPVYWFAIGLLALTDGLALLTLTDLWGDVTGQIAEALKPMLGPLM